LHQRGHHDHRELDDLREIVGVMKKMDGQSLGDPMKDGRSMVFQKTDGRKDGKKDDR
jgi:hypothetical protein